MKNRAFFWFFLPTAAAMLVFIAAPIASVVIQSFFSPHEAVLIETNRVPEGRDQNAKHHEAQAHTGSQRNGSKARRVQG